jgi:hypothetical protein
VRRNTSAIILVAAVFLAIVGLNFLFYIDAQEEQEETEATGSRSSYRSTPYGTLAFYTFLEEDGYPVTRLERAYTDLEPGDGIGTLVVIAPPFRYNPTAEEFSSLRKWVERGGLLILIDREIPSLDLDDQTQVDTFAALQSGEIRPLQPTIYTRGVTRLELTMFASRLRVVGPSTTAHFGDDNGPILADAAIGSGRVVMLTDPFVVSNNGITKADNFVLAVNLLAARPEGLIAFDEYHHGHGSQAQLGSASSGFLSYFKGTPVPWMMAQVMLIAALAVYSKGRRFVRPVPIKRERRTTNLEFVSSMANIIRLARARDLALQNIYSEFRRKLCRYAALPSSIATPKLASAVARRAGMDERGIRKLLMGCESVCRGGAVTDSQLLGLVSEIRTVEATLKL